MVAQGIRAVQLGVAEVPLARVGTEYADSQYRDTAGLPTSRHPVERTSPRKAVSVYEADRQNSILIECEFTLLL